MRHDGGKRNLWHDLIIQCWIKISHIQLNKQFIIAEYWMPIKGWYCNNFFNWKSTSSQDDLSTLGTMTVTFSIAWTTLSYVWPNNSRELLFTFLWKIPGSFGVVSIYVVLMRSGIEVKSHQKTVGNWATFHRCSEWLALIFRFTSCPNKLYFRTITRATVIWEFAELEYLESITDVFFLAHNQCV